MLFTFFLLLLLQYLTDSVGFSICFFHFRLYHVVSHSQSAWLIWRKINRRTQCFRNRRTFQKCVSLSYQHFIKFILIHFPSHVLFLFFPLPRILFTGSETTKPKKRVSRENEQIFNRTSETEYEKNEIRFAIFYHKQFDFFLKAQ